MTRTVYRFLGTFVLLLAAVAGSALSASESDVEELSRLERVWNEAHLHGDVAALDRLWSDDFLILVPEMPPISKSTAIEMWRGAKPSFTRYETSNTKPRVYGDAAVVTGDLHRTRDFGGRVADERWQFTKVYIRKAGQWKVVSFHASAAPKEAK